MKRLYTTLLSQKKNVILFAGLTIIIFSCTKKYAEYNTNPYQATLKQQEADNYITGKYFPAMINAVTPAGDIASGTDYANSYQVAFNLASDCYSGYMGQAGDWAGNINNLTYGFISGWINRQFILTGELMFSWQRLKGITDVTNDTLQLAVANIIRAIGIIRATDSYGPVPYSNLLTGTTTPAFDSQESIYFSVLEDLINARNLLNSLGATAGSPLEKYDLIYEGNYTRWAKLSNSLILRLAMRMVYADPEKAKQYAEEAVSNPAGLLSGIADNAEHSKKAANGAFSYTNPITVLSDRYNEARAGASIVSVLTGYKDPRLRAYFTNSNIPGYETEVVGIRSGSIITRSQYQPFSKLIVDVNTPLPWFRTSEVYFLKSEGALRGWNMGGTAKDFYESGVKAAFEESGVAMPSGYLNDDTLAPAKYHDYANSGNSGDMDYAQTSAITGVNNWSIKWNDAANFETKLHRIIMQKWIALFMNGSEGWAEYRRTGYPRILSVVSNKGVGISTRFQVRRLPYPAQQYNENGAQVAKAVGMLGGADNGGTRLWWDKKTNIPQ